MSLMFPKPHRVKSKSTVEKSRRKSCEYCGRTHDLETHHIISRGRGGGDLAINLVTLCLEHHHMAQDELITKDELFEIVSVREGIPVDEIRRTIAQYVGREYI